MANKEDIARFLHYISQLESSGGKNTNHKTIESGIHAGDQAVGEYGLMPNTMEELSSRYPASLPEEASPEQYAKTLAGRVLDRSHNDETLAAGLWNQGHNASPEKFPEVRDSDYAQKYDEMRSQIPYALDPNPYQQDFAEKEKQAQFAKLKGLVKN